MNKNKKNMNKKIVLIDMDGTIANFTKSILEKTKKQKMKILKEEEMTHFRVEKNFPEEN